MILSNLGSARVIAVYDKLPIWSIMQLAYAQINPPHRYQTWTENRDNQIRSITASYNISFWGPFVLDESIFLSIYDNWQ